MPEGKPWSIEEESALKQLVTAGHPLDTIAEKLGKPGEAVRQKIRLLGLEVVAQSRSARCIQLRNTKKVYVLPIAIANYKYKNWTKTRLWPRPMG